MELWIGRKPVEGTRRLATMLTPDSKLASESVDGREYFQLVPIENESTAQYGGPHIDETQRYLY